MREGGWEEVPAIHCSNRNRALRKEMVGHDSSRPSRQHLGKGVTYRAYRVIKYCGDVMIAWL